MDQVLLLFPQPVTTVHCRLHHDFPERDIESHAMIMLGFQDGATAVVDTSGLNAIPKPRILALGTRGAYAINGVDPQEAAMIKENIDEAEESPERGGRFHDGKEERSIPTRQGRWRSFYENVAGALTGKAEPAVKLPEVRRAMAVFDAALRSAENQEVVHANI